jgi:hypothetical protein
MKLLPITPELKVIDLSFLTILVQTYSYLGTNLNVIYLGIHTRFLKN